MKEISYYLRNWNLSNPKLLISRITSHVYTVTYQGQLAILKLLTATGMADEKNGALALQYFDGNGAVRLFQHDEGAQLLEYAAGEDLKSLVLRGEDEKATKIIAGVLKSIHSIKNISIPLELTPLKLRFGSLFEKSKQDQSNGISCIYIKAANVAEKLLSAPKDLCVLHGDIHHENIKHSVRGWLAIDPKGLYGERTFDVANTLCNPADMDDFVANENRLLKNANLLANHLNLDVSRVLAFTFAYAGLSAAWSLEDQQDSSLALKIAAIIEPHLN